MNVIVSPERESVGWIVLEDECGQPKLYGRPIGVAICHAASDHCARNNMPGHRYYDRPEPDLPTVPLFLRTQYRD